MASRDHVERLREWAQFYQYRKNDPRSLSQQVAFNNTMIDGMMEIIALLINDYEQARGRTLESSSILWVPDRFRRLDGQVTL